MSSAAILMSPLEKPSVKRADLKDQIEEMINYREGWKEVKHEKGAEFAYMINLGNVHELNFGEFTGDEIGLLHEIAKQFGGQYLVTWTYGNTVSLIYFNNPNPGKTPKVHEASFRLNTYSFRRNSALVNDFLEWVSASCFEVDVKDIDDLLQEELISVVKWFDCFGIGGARELESKKTEELWNLFDQISANLMQGEKVNKKSLKKINQEIKAYEEEAILKVEPEKDKGVMARQIAQAAYCLKETVGESKDLRWQERYRAASFYWDITDCKESYQRLIAGEDDKQGLGHSAALGRLVAHYPKELARDGVFWSLAAHETESANGHAYTQSLCSFAEHAHQAGFTLAVFPVEKQEEFRKDFEIYTFENAPQLDQSWAGEAFLDLPELVKKDIQKELEEWFKKNKVNGCCLRAEANGKTDLKIYQDGKQDNKAGKEVFADQFNVDHTQIVEVAQELDLRDACAALGLPDLLEPGEWKEGAYKGERASEEDAEKRVEVLERFSNPPECIPVPDCRFLLLDTVKTDQRWDIDQSVVKFAVNLATEDRDYLLDLKKDLLGKGLIEDCGQAWIKDKILYGMTRTGLGARQWLRILADLPDGCTVLVDINDKSLKHYQVDSSAKPPEKKQFFSKIKDLASRSKEKISQSNKRAKEKNDSAGVDQKVLYAEQFLAGLKSGDIVKETILENENATYSELDISNLLKFRAQELGPIRETLEENGFKKIGVVHCDVLGNNAIMVFASQQMPIWSTATIYDFGNIHVDFYTAFENGQSLTTTTDEFAFGNPSQGIKVNIFNQKKGIGMMYTEHCVNINKNIAKDWETVPVGKTVKEYVEALDEFLTRRKG